MRFTVLRNQSVLLESPSPFIKIDNLDIFLE